MSSPDYEIRRTSHASSEIDQLKSLMEHYIVDFYHYPVPRDDSLQSLIERLRDEPAFGLQYIAVARPNEVVGFATLYFSFNTLQLRPFAILHDLYVDPNCRGEGLGTQLFEECLKYVREHEMLYMSWETADDNHAAQALYNKLGAHKSPWLAYEIS